MDSGIGGRRSEYRRLEIGQAKYRNGEPRRDCSVGILNSEQEESPAADRG